MAVAFFDLDRTLISRNSATLWIKFEYAEHRITWRQALRAASWVLRLGVAPAFVLIRHCWRHLSDGEKQRQG